MLLLINDRRLMGSYTNGSAMNIVSWLTVSALVILSLAMVVSLVWGG
jgi:Mn2+/Fe2+ NRAMP family transporter